MSASTIRVRPLTAGLTAEQLTADSRHCAAWIRLEILNQFSVRPKRSP